jgi:hypothetical protein
MDKVAEKLLETETMEREAFLEAVGIPPANPDNTFKSDSKKSSSEQA